MVKLLLKKKLIIPSLCPKCGSKLNHVNAIDTEAEVYIVFCTNSKCRYCKDWKKLELIKKCL